MVFSSKNQCIKTYEKLWNKRKNIKNHVKQYCNSNGAADANYVVIVLFICTMFLIYKFLLQELLPYDRWLVGWFVRWSLIISYKGGKLHFYAPIGALVDKSLCLPTYIIAVHDIDSDKGGLGPGVRGGLVPRLHRQVVLARGLKVQRLRDSYVTLKNKTGFYLV